MTVVTAGAAWPSLDPANPTIIPQEADEDPAVEPLFYTSAKGQIVPFLASKYSVSADGLTITIDLRKGINFQDGTPFNAQAVVDNLERYASPAVNSECVTYLSVMQSATATDPYTVTVKLSEKDASFMPVLASQQCSFMVSPTAVAKEGASFGQHPVGTGAYTFVSGTTGVVAKYQHWPGYWQKGKGYLDNITVENVGSNQDALHALQAGTAQVWTGITSGDAAAQVAQAKGASNLNVMSAPAAQINYVALNFTQPPFNNLTARQALLYATNQSQITSKLYQGAYKPVQGVFPPFLWTYSDKVKGYPTYNLNKAKDLVKQLGGISFTLSVNNTPGWLAEAEALQNQWAQAGIKVTIDPLDAPHLISRLHALSYQGLLIVSPALTDPDMITYRWFYSKSKLTQGGLKDSQADQLILSGRQTYSQGERKPKYSELNDLLGGQQVVWDNVFSQTYFQVQSSKVQGYPANPTAYVPWAEMSMSNQS